VSKWRTFAAGFVCCYLVGALIMGSSMYRVMPCLNLFGATYYGALWPLAPLSVAINRPLYPIPLASFTFPCRGEQEHHHA
jgi:hypothetical protein